MNRRLALRLASLAAALALVATAPLAAPPSSAAPTDAGTPPTTIDFAGMPYLHRWSKAGQNEFTPAAQTDLDHWTDMVTLLVYDKVATEDQLANIAGRLLAAYKKDGAVIRAVVLHATPERKAEYLIVGVLAGGGSNEIVFTRLVMTSEAGEALMYAHRLYGEKATVALGTADWLKANGPATEQALTTWQDGPSVSALRTLPQAP